jgi:ABC-2 type transport system ATP-binding protein
MKESTPLVIETRGLTKTYKGVQALRSLDLQVHQHSILGFLGPNGAGKTTTIKLLLGLIRPSAGHGTVFGHDIAHQGIEIRRRVGYLAQQPRYYEHMTAREILRFRARFFYRGPQAAIEARVTETLELVGLSDKADRPIRGFSGGEMQRLGLAQAQVNYPDLLILDEPAANLDPMGRRDVLEVMERLRQHTTIFYSTHILDDVQRVGDAVAILNHGELVAQAPIEELLAGSAGSVYSLVLQGDPSAAYARVIGQPWVAGIQVGRRNGHVTWAVSVSDEEAAQAELLRLVLAEQSLDVIEFGRKKHEMEEVFMQIVEGGAHVQQ